MRTIPTANDDGRMCRIPRYVLVALLLSFAIAATLRAQEPAVPASAFEVATVKRSTAPLTASGFRASPSGLVNITGLPLREMIKFAYSAVEVVGGPAWIGTDRFDVEARAPAGAKLETAMLRTLLAERFKLQVHTENRELPIYDLVMARQDRAFGPRLSRSTCAPPMATDAQQPGVRPCVPFRLGGGASITAEGVTMEELAARLAGFPAVQRPVRDRTGLTGAFDFQITFVGISNPDPNAGPGLFTALQEQLGLKLESQNAPVEVVVVDRAEAPTEN